MIDLMICIKALSGYGIEMTGISLTARYQKRMIEPFRCEPETIILVFVE